MNNRHPSAPQDIHLLDAARTPFGRFFGALADQPATRLAARVLDTLAGRLPVAAAGLYAGVGMAAGGSYSPARQAVLESDLPDHTPSLAADRACASGMTAVGLACRELAAAPGQLLLAGGFESLSRMPGLAARRRRTRPGDPAAFGEIADPLALSSPGDTPAIAVYTGEEALARGVDRARQDAWALQSHERFFSAEARGDFAAERLVLPELATDESPRAGLSLDALARLETLYGGPTVTAGNAPGLSDGAAFVALGDGQLIREAGLESLARLTDYVAVAGELRSASWLPALAIQRLLERQDLALSDIHLLEINEAYAATPLVSLRELAGGDANTEAELAARTNVNGGAVAIGHPLGASGTRLLMGLAHALRRRGGGRGIAAICGAYGQAEALLVEVS